MSDHVTPDRMTLAQAQEIDAAWPRPNIHDAAQAKVILTAHRDHSLGLPLDYRRHGARPGSAWAAWYESYYAEIPDARRMGLSPIFNAPYEGTK